MDLIDMRIAEDFKERIEARKNRVRSGTWAPSSFGRCYRNQYWNRKNEPISNPPSLASLKKMEQGIYSHKLIQQHFRKEETEVRIELVDILGFADIVLDDCVIDLKFTEPFGYKFWNVPTPKIVANKRNSCYQVVFYAMMLQKPKAILRGGKFGMYGGIDHDVYSPSMVQEVKDEISVLRAIWDKQELPKAEPRAFSGKECNYCNWQDKCKEIECGSKDKPREQG